MQRPSLLLLALCAASCGVPPQPTAAGAAADPPVIAACAGAAAQPNAAGSGADPTGFDGPRLLSETGLYSAACPHTLAPGVSPYEPLGELWADGATKRRWIWLPPGSAIDSSNMDLWRYPVGTKVWKEFARDGVLLETRLIEKLAEERWRMVAYAWNAEQSEAAAVPLGVQNAAGTDHDVPDSDACSQCHEGAGDRVLGFSALQLSHPAAGVTLEQLVTEGKLTRAPAQPLRFPGDTVDQTALAYLHANCGHCHNPRRKRAEREISVHFWQDTGALAQVSDTPAYKTLVETKNSRLWIDAVQTRMQQRGGLQQMPPLATEHVDRAGMSAVGAFLDRLRARFPAQPPLPPVAANARCEGVEKIFAIFERAACRSAFCHGAGIGELDFTTPEQLHASMVGVPATGEGCSELPLPRVQPGDPERSLLLLKLRPGPPCGKIMPPADVQALSPDEIQQVAAWIAACKP